MSSTPVLHHTQVRLALGPDARPRARLANITDAPSDGAVSVRFLDGTTTTVNVVDAARLTATLERSDLCRLNDQPLILLSTHHGVLAVATGPAAPPTRLVVTLVSRLEDGAVVELIGDAEQPAWQLFAVTSTPPALPDPHDRGGRAGNESVERPHRSADPPADGAGTPRSR